MNLSIENPLWNTLFEWYNFLEMVIRYKFILVITHSIYFTAVGKSRGHSIRRIAYVKNLGIHEESVEKKPLLNINIIETAQSEDSQMTEKICLEDASPKKGGTSRNLENKNDRKISGTRGVSKRKSKKQNPKTEIILDDDEGGWTKVSVRKKRHRNRNRDRL